MKKFMKITTGIVAKIAFFAIVCATAYGVAHLWDTTGLVVLLGVVLLGWIIVGLIPDKKALAYAEMQLDLAISEGEVEKLRKERDELISHTVELADELAKAEVGLKNASGTIAELKAMCDEWDAKLKEVAIERNKYYSAWEESAKREEMSHKQLREKQGEMEYFRSRHNALKSETEARKVDEGVFVGTDLSADKDVEREATVEVPLAEAEAEAEAESVEVAAVPAPSYPRRHKIKRQCRKPSQS